jgi:hypothetical protein
MVIADQLPLPSSYFDLCPKWMQFRCDLLQEHDDDLTGLLYQVEC